MAKQKKGGEQQGSPPFGEKFTDLDYSRVEVAADVVAKREANVAIPCWSRDMMRSPRFARDDN